MSYDQIAAEPGGCPLPEPWELERQEAEFEGDEIVLHQEGVGLYLPLPGETHPRVKLRFEIQGEQPFSFLAYVGSVDFSFGGMQTPNNSISRQGQTIAQAPGPVGEVSRWYLIEMEARAGHVRMTIDGETFMEGQDPEGPSAFHQISTKHWGEQRLRNLIVEYEEPKRAAASRPERFDLQMVVDFADDILHGQSFTRGAFESLFDTLKSWGVSRTYWHYFLVANHFPDRQTLFGDTLGNVGDFLKLVIDLAHEREMELYATLKPFDILWSARTDEPFHANLLNSNQEPPQPVGVTGRLGGERVYLPGWLKGHEEALVKRCPVEMPDGPIIEVEIVKENDEPAGFELTRIELWVSEDNRTYTRHEGSLQVAAACETRPRLCQTPRGPVEEPEQETVTVVRITGLKISEPYFAVTVSQESGALQFCNQHFKLLAARTADGKRVPITLGLFPGRKFGARSADFREAGVAFDWGDGATQGIWGQPDFVEARGSLHGPCGFLAFARGKNRYLDMLSASHPLSHKLWLEIVDRCIDLGVDGMDFRIRCHKSSVEWSGFGFEPGVVDAFRDRYGVDIRYEDFDAEAWRRLRGEQYTDFVRAASTMLHDAGRKLQHHVSPGMVPPPSQPTMLHIHFDWERWLQEGLIDSITCKQLEHSTAFFDQVRETAHAHGAPIYDCPYINTYFHKRWKKGDSAWAARLRKNIQLARATSLDGYMIYENAAVLRADGDAVAETREGLGDLFRQALLAIRAH